MMELSLNGHEIYNGIIKNSINLFSINPDLQRNWKGCLKKNGSFSVIDLNQLFKKNDIDMDSLLLSSCPYTRYLGFFLLFIRGGTSERLWSAFEDPFVHIRRLIITHFTNSNRHKLFNEIFTHFTTDPRLDVRKAALSRIKKDFSDLFSYRIENLSNKEQRHILYLMNGKNSHDRNILKNFVSSQCLELSSLAVYCLQKIQSSSPIKALSYASRVSLWRYSSLHKYCQRGNSFFLKVFNYINSDFPLNLQDKYIHELSLLTPSDENKDSYEHAIHLINERSDPLCTQRLEEFYDNSEIYRLFGNDLIQGFSQKNRYQTFPLLIKILKREKSLPMKKKLMDKAVVLQIPLPKDLQT